MFRMQIRNGMPSLLRNVRLAEDCGRSIGVVVSSILCKRFSRTSAVRPSSSLKYPAVRKLPRRHPRSQGMHKGAAALLWGEPAARGVPALFAGAQRAPGVGGTRPPRLSPGGGNGKGGDPIPCCRRLISPPLEPHLRRSAARSFGLSGQGRPNAIAP